MILAKVWPRNDVPIIDFKEGIGRNRGRLDAFLTTMGNVGCRVSPR